MNAFTNLRMFQKGLVIVGIPLVFELIFLSILIFLQLESEKRTEEVTRSRETISAANGLSKLYYDGAKAMLAYSATRAEIARRDFEDTIGKIQGQLDKLKDLTRANARQAANYDRLAPLAGRMLSAFREINSGLSTDPQYLDAYHQMHPRGELVGLLNQLGNAIYEIMSTEKKLSLDNPIAERQARLKVLAWLIIGVIFNLMLAAFLVYMFSREVVSRLNILTENTRRLAAKEALHAPLPGNDELAHLDQVFHDMAFVLADAERKRNELEQRKQEFVAMVSHDLRAPLASIQAFLAGLAEGIYKARPEQITQRAENLGLAANRLIDLINSMLDAEKNESADIELYMDSFPAIAIVNQAVNSIRYLAEQAHLLIEVSAMDFAVHGDEDLLVRVLQNLLSNAVKFSPRDSTIFVTGGDDGQWVTFKVKDSGKGIAPEYQRGIFDKFKQVPSADGRPQVGTGLGLTICKQIVEKHGGKIGVESMVGSGSTFWFSLPSIPSGTEV